MHSGARMFYQDMPSIQTFDVASNGRTVLSVKPTIIVVPQRVLRYLSGTMPFPPPFACQQQRPASALGKRSTQHVARRK